MTIDANSFGPPRVCVEREEPAGRIEGGTLEEIEQRAGVVEEPEPVRGERDEARGTRRRKISDPNLRRHVKLRSRRELCWNLLTRLRATSGYPIMRRGQ